MARDSRAAESAGNMAFYDADAGIYDERRFSDHAGREEDRKSRSLISEFAGSWIDRNVLEVGCGSGRISEVLAEGSHSLTLCDISAQMLTEASRRVNSKFPSVDVSLAKGSVYELPFASSSFDCLVSINVLTHIRDLEGALSEFRRILRPGGSLIFSISNRNSLYLPAALVVNRRGRAFGHDVPSFWHSRRSAVSIMGALGFLDVETRGMFHVPRSVRSLPGLGNAVARLNSGDGHARLAGIAPWVLVRGHAGSK